MYYMSWKASEAGLGTEAIVSASIAEKPTMVDKHVIWKDSSLYSR